VRGSPIRKSSDQRSVDSSPRLIAASYVLHRLLVPRHPPCALNNLTTHTHAHPQQKRPNHHPRKETTTRPTPVRGSARISRYTLGKNKDLARCSRPLCSSQATTSHPTSPTASPGHPNQQSTPGGTTSMEPCAEETPTPHRSGAARSLRTQQRAYDQPHPTTTFQTPTRRAVLAAMTMSPAELVSVPPSSSTPDTRDHPKLGDRQRPGRGSGPPQPVWRPVLLRKEVIQPHLPVRLPCYDFVPIADPAFDGSLPQGVGPPASGVTDFRDVTGGVYKARERIHRSVADLRLLATPTSWGRVADPNPN
jgi:hypothetical protein